MTWSQVRSAIPDLRQRHDELRRCPACRGPLGLADAPPIACGSCRRGFGVEEGIPLLFWPTEWTDRVDVTETVKAFYEETPFPNYDDLDSQESLRRKAEQGVFARLLDDQLPYGVKVLEVGCGTGQLSNYLALTWGRTVFGADVCLNSLRLGRRFADDNDIANVAFVQMNLFRPVFEPESFDLVIANGVLHHTSDPFLGFRTILTCLKNGGHIIIGLYNTYGRLPTDLRRMIFQMSGDRLRFLDPRLRVKGLSEIRRHAWFMDQYKHPHESTHTIGEVLGWFDRAGVDFVNGIPKCAAAAVFSARGNLFDPGPRGTPIDHVLVQLGMLLSGGGQGGLFVMIGRKVGHRGLA
jgi:SAM-dependent methyltransferase